MADEGVFRSLFCQKLHTDRQAERETALFMQTSGCRSTFMSYRNLSDLQRVSIHRELRVNPSLSLSLCLPVSQSTASHIVLVSVHYHLLSSPALLRAAKATACLKASCEYLRTHGWPRAWWEKSQENMWKDETYSGRMRSCEWKNEQYKRWTDVLKGAKKSPTSNKRKSSVKIVWDF